MLKLGLVEVPDCTNPPLPWWESSGVLPAVVLVSIVLVVALAVLVGVLVIDSRSPDA